MKEYTGVEVQLRSYLSTGWKWVVTPTPQPFFLQEKDPDTVLIGGLFGGGAVARLDVLENRQISWPPSGQESQTLWPISWSLLCPYTRISIEHACQILDTRVRVCVIICYLHWMYLSMKAELRDMKGIHYWKIWFLTPSCLFPMSNGEQYSCRCLILQGTNGRKPAVWWCACRDGVLVVRSYLSSGIYITREEVVDRLALRAGTLSCTKSSVCSCQCWNVIWQPDRGWAKLTLYSAFGNSLCT
jgi:hypothetical protein